MAPAPRALPAYEIVGDPGKELVLNAILYGLGIALLLSVLWVLLPFATARGSGSDADDRGGGAVDRDRSG